MKQIRVFGCGLTMANESRDAGCGSGWWDGVLGEKRSRGRRFSKERMSRGKAVWKGVLLGVVVVAANHSHYVVRLMRVDGHGYGGAYRLFFY